MAGGFFPTAVRTAIGESGLAGFEFEFFAADCTGFDGIGHVLMILGQVGGVAESRPFKANERVVTQSSSENTDGRACRAELVGSRRRG